MVSQRRCSAPVQYAAPAITFSNSHFSTVCCEPCFSASHVSPEPTVYDAPALVVEHIFPGPAASHGASSCGGVHLSTTSHESCRVSSCREVPVSSFCCVCRTSSSGGARQTDTSTSAGLHFSGADGEPRIASAYSVCRTSSCGGVQWSGTSREPRSTRARAVCSDSASRRTSAVACIHEDRFSFPQCAKHTRSTVSPPTHPR